MRRLSGFLILSCALLAACGSGGGGSSSPPITTLYVRESGDDDATGTSPDRALKTAARAGQLLAPGVTVYVGPGRYEGRIDITGIDTTAAAPIRLIADTEGIQTGDAPGDVILDAGGDIFAVRVSNTSFVTIDGFIIVGADGTNSTGIQVRSTSTDVTIRNCVISNAGPADGIRVQNSNDIVVFNNLIFDNNRGVRIADGSQDAQIINNTIADNRAGGVSIGGANAQGVAATGATVRNNVIQDSRNNVSISVDDGPPSARPGYTGNFNLAFITDLDDQTKTYRPAVIRGDDDVNEDALFVDAENGDYHLADDSPARNQGTGAIDAALVNALLQRSTTADGALDTPPVDIGYHYPVTP